MAARQLVGLTLALVFFALPASAQDQCPEAAQRRFQEALQLSLQAKHRDSASVYRSVADWPDGGDFPERARSLHAAASELEVAGDIEQALATYREVVRRFPKSPFAVLAGRAVQRIEPPGVSGGVEFQRRQAEALDVLLPAIALNERRDVDGARPGLEKAVTLLGDLLRDFEAHPKAVDVAIALSDALARLQRFGEAYAAAEKAIVLAEREASKPGAPNTVLGDVANAKKQYAATRRAFHLWLVADTGCKALIAVLGLILASRRPWLRLTRRHVKLLAVLTALEGVLALAAVVGAEYVRRFKDPDSVVTDGIAAVLVLVPGLLGVGLAVGLAGSVSGRRGAILGGACGVIGSLATSVCLIHYFRLYGLLPEI
jgi:tetratricopeptide (TPR) repeat protein